MTLSIARWDRQRREATPRTGMRNSGPWIPLSSTRRSHAGKSGFCAQCLFVGKVTCLDGDTGKPVAELDYGPISRPVTTKPWSDPTSNPLGDLKAAQRLSWVSLKDPKRERWRTLHTCLRPFERSIARGLPSLSHAKMLLRFRSPGKSGVCWERARRTCTERPARWPESGPATP
jgi:hypothetical protein